MKQGGPSFVQRFVHPGARFGRVLLCILPALVFSAPVMAAVDLDRDAAPDAAPTWRPRHAPNRLLVKFDRGVSDDTIVRIDEAARAETSKRFRLDSQLRLVTIRAGVDLGEAIAAYCARPEVLYVELDYVAHALKIPNDPRFNELWGLHNTGQGTGDPGGKQCQGGADSGMVCFSDLECRGACSDNTAPCTYDWQCDGNCSQDYATCTYDWQCQDHCTNNGAHCIYDTDCGGGQCSDNMAPCTYDWQCQKKCSNNGAYCTYDWQCGSRLCQGGVNNGDVCVNDYDCDDRACIGGTNPGQACLYDSQCGATCRNGTNPGQSCMYDSQCGATCRNGTSPGQSCIYDSQCGATCQGGTHPGQSCSYDSQCGTGGTCVHGECVHGECIEGVCSAPGVCGPQPTCDQPLCLFPGQCAQSICEIPTCVATSCASPAGVADFDVDAPEAWELKTVASHVVLASIDTGVQFSHEDMSPAWTNPGEIPGNGLDDDGNGYADDVHGWDFINEDNDPNDDNWHGTFTMSVAAAVGDNGLGIVGAAWSAQVMALKALDSAGYGYVSDAIEAIDYATENGALITNNSYGGLSYSAALEDAIERAEQAGVLFVAAAGNDGVNLDIYPDYPASYTTSNIVSVAAVTRFSQLASFSNYGLTSVDLGAPGSEILGATTYPHKYGYEDGTSFAAPFVAGAAALIYERNPNLTYAQVKQYILNGVVADDSLQSRSVTGGVLNIRNSLNQAPACTPTTCAAAGAECGTIPSGCWGDIDCGGCLYGVCESHQCVCTPITCGGESAECGTLPDGCGGQLSCGACGEIGAKCTSNQCICTPTQQARRLTVEKVAGGIKFCWTAPLTSCVDGYHLLGSNDATTDENWSTVATTGETTTCWTGNPAQGFYLVIAHGEGGDGPWGHY